MFICIRKRIRARSQEKFVTYNIKEYLRTMHFDISNSDNLWIYSKSTVHVNIMNSLVLKIDIWQESKVNV